MSNCVHKYLTIEHNTLELENGDRFLEVKCQCGQCGQAFAFDAKATTVDAAGTNLVVPLTLAKGVTRSEKTLATTKVVKPAESEPESEPEIKSKVEEKSDGSLHKTPKVKPKVKLKK